MNDPEYLRGHCEQCGGEIEFPTAAAGQSTACPLCGQSTNLVALVPAAKTSAAATSARPGLWRIWIFVVIAAAILPSVMVLRHGSSPTGDNSAPGTNSVPQTTSTQPPTPATNAPAASPTAPRSLEDLKTGPVTLEKAKNGSLVYAVGILRNESDHQRFGVNIEIELTDARGNDAGTAKDYRAVIEPRQEWRFRALVLNSKATQGKVARVREE